MNPYTGNWKGYNSTGDHRILITKMLPGKAWLEMLINSGFTVVINTSDGIVPKNELLEMIGKKCAGVIGQLTEIWDKELFEALKRAGGKVYCNYAVGIDNINIKAASQNKIAVGNTPGVLTETTAEMAVTLTLACARKIVEADNYTRNNKFDGWLPDLFLGEQLWRKTLGIVGSGRIGSSYAMMMTHGFQMNLIYYGRRKNDKLENRIDGYNSYLKTQGIEAIKQKKADTLEEVLQNADIISLHIPLNQLTHHLIDIAQLNIMKENAILINTSRGPVINEIALTNHCRENEKFRVGLDVFENEPFISDDLKKLPNVTMTPHIGSATNWTRESMALLAALNIKGIIEGYPVWDREDITPFLQNPPPKAIPSIVNTAFL